MNQQPKWTKITFILAVILLVLGTLDPMEGSVLIAVSTALLAVVTRITNDRHRFVFMLNAVCVAAGVIYLFAISSVGGFGGDTGRSWWWSLPIAPYPLGWLSTVILLIARGVRGLRNTQHKVAA